MMTSETINGIGHVRISGEMSMYTAIDARALLQETLLLCKEVEIDLSEVAEIDSAGLQLLIQAKREGTRIGVPVRLVFHSPAVQEIIDLYRLALEFGDPMAMARR
jgi:anti-sigma B factor antagonist